jgi:hypothetical protein
MADFTIRSDNIDVEQIMRQIRARIKEKRGVDYTEQEIRELAAVKLERFLDPRALRSDLLAHYRERRPVQGLPNLPPAPPTYAFDDETIYASHRGPLRWIRRLLNPLLKLFFNPNPMIQVLHMQAAINDFRAQQIDTIVGRIAARDELSYEVLHNLVLELTRLGIETRNLKMRFESLATRLDFDERRARALEGMVQYRPGALAAEPTAAEGAEPASVAAEGEAVGRLGKRRRRRRGRRRGPGEGGEGGGSAEPDTSGASDGQSEGPHANGGAGGSEAGTTGASRADK